MSFEHLANRLHHRQADGLLRAPVVVEQYQQQYMLVEGRAYVNFSSNDYLGLAQHPSLLKQALNNSELLVGSGGSPLVTGHSRYHQQLIDYVCEQTNREAGLLCNSGFAANFSVLHSLLDTQNEMVFLDKLAHASMIDGAQASKGTLRRFKHNDVEHLSQLLSSQTAQNKLVVTEGVFSMDGDVCPAKALSSLCAEQDAWLMIDDAHAIGILGREGFGHADSDGLSQAQLPIWMATFGKAIGTGGAIITGSETLISYLQNFARHYIYSTAMSPQQAFITLLSLQTMKAELWRREKLMQLVMLFKEKAKQIGLQLLDSDSAIQPVIIGDPQRAINISSALKEKGIWVSAIRAPTVPKGTDRLRFTITAHHEEKDIDYLMSCLEEAMQR